MGVTEGVVDDGDAVCFLERLVLGSGGRLDVSHDDDDEGG